MTTKLPTALLEPCWGNRRIDRRAWSVIERCRKRQASERPPLPIPVEDWIEGPLGIQLGFADLSYLGDNVLGAAFVKSREILIDEQVLSHEGRCRFTCAHELGHLTLHSNLRNEFHDSQVDVTFSLETIERQADRFAAAFLMPLPLLERELVGVLDKTGLKRTECIYELMQSSPESEWLWRYRVLPMITERFGVSLSAAVYRCSDVQAKISNAQPFLPRSLTRRLLERPTGQDPVAGVEVVEGVPTYRDLFTESEGVR